MNLFLDSAAHVTIVIVARTEFWWNPRRPDQPSLWENKIQLSELFFNEIIQHPVLIDMNTLTALKRSPLGLDLYLCGLPGVHAEAPAAAQGTGMAERFLSARTRPETPFSLVNSHPFGSARQSGPLTARGKGITCTNERFCNKPATYGFSMALALRNGIALLIRLAIPFVQC